MPLFNQAGKRRSARLNNESATLQSQSSLPVSAHSNPTPITLYEQPNSTMSQPPMNQSSHDIENLQTTQPSIPLEDVNEDNEAYWDNYYEYDTSFGWIPQQSSETERPPMNNEANLQEATPPMKAAYDKGLNYDYYNDPSYVTTNEDAERYMNDSRHIVKGSQQPSAEEQVIMLEEEIRQLMDTNRTLQQSISDVQ